MAAAKRDKQQYLCILVNIVTIKVRCNLNMSSSSDHLDLKTVIFITYEDDVLY